MLQLIEEHPEGRLELPARDAIRADLRGVNLNRDRLRARLLALQIESASWFDASHDEHGLGGANLRGANLQKAILKGANLERANLGDANLQGANLEGASLAWANLQRAILKEINLQGANLSSAKLQGAKLKGVNLQGTILLGVNLEGADLRHANFRGVKLQHANLRNANLQGATLVRADLLKADLLGANLQGATLVSANLQGANLSRANLQEANLAGANLQQGDLDDAKLQNADLRQAELQRVDLSNATITHIYISNAWLDKTRLWHKQLGGAIGEDLAGEYEQAKHGYLALKQNFGDLGDYDAVNWAYRKERRMEKLEARQNARDALAMHEWQESAANCAKFISDQLVEWLCDYGESVWRVMGWMAAIILIIGPVLFGLWGKFDWVGNNRDTYFNLPTYWQQQVYAYFQLVLYTVDTFTTANFADLEPINDFTRLASSCLAMLGIFLAGLLGFVAGNRIRQS